MAALMINGPRPPSPPIRLISVVGTAPLAIAPD